MEELTSKERKTLQTNIWYHGTVYSNWNNICSEGVLAEYNKDSADALDFGYGFYLAPTKEKAESYILRMIENTNFYDENEQAIILGFEFVPLKWFEEEIYITKVLGNYDDEFALFVFENRTTNVAGEKQHNYDVLYGVMSDSVPTKEIQEYKMGLKTREQVLEALKKPTSMKQLSLHNQNICDIIKLKEAYIISDKETNLRKELDVNEYCKSRND